MFYRYRFLSRSAAIVFALGLVMSPATSAVGASTSGTSNATIVSPLSINVINPFLAFGQVVPSASPGTVVITANSGGGTTRTATGGASVQPGPFGASVFFVSGESGSPVTVVLPTSIFVNSGANTMTVDTFQSNPPSPYNQPASGQFLSVGGTLHVAANQAPGAYSGTFDVSVNY
jgi:Mat/Ecp fimbriae major subunit